MNEKKKKKKKKALKSHQYVCNFDNLWFLFSYMKTNEFTC